MIATPSQKITLDRRLITGKLNESTPICVIKQIIKSMGYIVNEDNVSDIYIGNILRVIEDKIESIGSVPALASSWSEEDASLISIFINGGEQWNVKTLNKAFEHILPFLHSNTIHIDSLGDFRCGDKTPKFPLSYDSCMLYAICKSLNIKTFRSTNDHQMKLAIDLYQEEDILEQTLDIIKCLPKSEIISIRMGITNSRNPKPRRISATEIVDDIPSIQGNTNTLEEINKTYDKLRDISHIYQRLAPSSHLEAIVLGSIVHGIDFSESANPFREYNEKTSKGELYVPIDRLFRKRYLANFEWYNISKNWNPNFIFLYTFENIREFSIFEGQNDGLSDYNQSNFLWHSRTIPTFYMGIVPTIIKTGKEELVTMIERENVFEYQNFEIISYGVATSGDIEFYLVSDLIGHFSTHKTFTNPCNKMETLSDTAINKLVNICTYVIENYKRQESKQHKELLTIIKKIKLMNSNCTKESLKLKKFYNSSLICKEQIEEFFNKIIDLGFYMRSWKVAKIDPSLDANVPPLTLEYTNSKDENKGEIDINVSNAIVAIEEFIMDLPDEFRGILSSLPLILRTQDHKGQITFTPSRSLQEGLTIFDRISICRDGDEVLGCIRTSSNHFLATACFYMRALAIDERFEMDLVHYIH
jgi:hypothetical protein